MTKPRRASEAGAGERWGGIGDRALVAATGKPWKHWLARLDRAKAFEHDHAWIASHAHEQLGLRPWWSQMVAVGYEQARGLRKPHQTSRGFQAGASRTLGHASSAVYAAFGDARRRAAWLAHEHRVRTATAGKSMRITWSDDTRVEVYFVAKGAAKTQVAVQHGKLAGEREVVRAKAWWKLALDRLSAELDAAAARGPRTAKARRRARPAPDAASKAARARRASGA